MTGTTAWASGSTALGLNSAYRSATWARSGSIVVGTVEVPAGPLRAPNSTRYQSDSRAKVLYLIVTVPKRYLDGTTAWERYFRSRYRQGTVTCTVGVSACNPRALPLTGTNRVAVLPLLVPVVPVRQILLFPLSLSNHVTSRHTHKTGKPISYA
jgi:hypothetical protein